MSSVWKKFIGLSVKFFSSLKRIKMQKNEIFINFFTRKKASLKISTHTWYAHFAFFAIKYPTAYAMGYPFLFLIMR
jgi:hypothetical protein